MADRFSKLICLSRVLTLTLLVGNPVWAEDIEIFFDRSSNADTQPNVLFILDGSGSMNWYDCANGDVKSYNCGDGTPAGTTTRLSRLKSSLKQVLNNTSNINVGLMRFSHTDSGGRIIYPVENIDQQLCNGEPCDDDTIFESQSRPKSSEDDAAQQTNKSVAVDEQSIMLFNPPGIPVGNTWVGLRFPELQIPQGATITDARLIFTSETDNTNAANMVIHAEDVADAEPFSASSNNIGKRNKSYETVSWNTIDDWGEEGTYESPNLATLVQPIISKSDWCGGQAMGLIIKGSGDRLMTAFDSGDGKAPALRVSYKLDAVSPAGGCSQSSVKIRLGQSADDAIEATKSNGGGTHKVKRWHGYNIVSKPSSSRRTGYDSALRFREVNIPRESKILSATLTLTTRQLNWYNTYPNITISAHDSANSSPIYNSNGNIFYRQLTGNIDWPGITSTKNTEVTSPQLTPLVQDIVDKGNWVSGNAMTLVLKPDGNGGHGFYSYDSNPSRSPILKIDFETQIRSAQDKITGPVTDVRSELIEEIDSIVANHGTPTVGALLEAKRYFAGGKVKYGLNRYADRNDIGWPNYYGRYSRVSTPESYTGGTIVRQSSCNSNALDAKTCANEYISGGPVYVSPFTHECQSNHIVLLTDGSPTVDAGAAAEVKTFVPGGCVDQPAGEGTCGEEIAKYLNTEDQHSFPGKQVITTHTIGFNFTTQWLKDVAKEGGGGFYTADTAAQLSAALSNIINSVQDDSSTFVAPGATVDNFSKVSHRSDIYLALFQPQNTPGWDGNLKRYDFIGDPAVLRDQNNVAAVDTNTGEFLDSSQSHWSDESDGNSVAEGGAAYRLTKITDRKVYTHTGTSDDLRHGTNQVAIGNSKITPTLLGLSDSETAKKDELIKWAIGQDVKDEDGDGNKTEKRAHIGDPLHSRPVIITYGLTEPDKPDSVLFFGTNDGFLHAIQSSTGDEVFSFIPSELLPNLNPLYNANPADDKIYGLDGPMSLMTNDVNDNGTIESGDSVWLYAGMRRGGNSYYALNITDKAAPQFMWKKSGGDTGFEEMGQTWSQAVPASIKLGGHPKDVLIFGGGYDVEQDEKKTRSEDSIGRAIFIVDAENGDLIWSAGPTGGTGMQSFNQMTYSFPSSPQVVDADGNGHADQIYIGDMGGRIWRFDVNQEAASATADFVTGGVIADLGQDGIIADTRRFYHTPDVSMSTINNEVFINIAIGSGYQAHPLDTAIEDRFYLLRIPNQLGLDGHYGIPVTTTTVTAKTDVSHLLEPEVDSDSETTTTTVDYLPIRESDLFNATSNILAEGDSEERDDAEAELARSHGWYLEMETSGEKVLGSSVTFDNKILFASYAPGGTPDGCAPEIGHGIFWVVNLWDATPAAEQDGDESKLSKGDRNKPIPGGGIPAPIQTLFIESGNPTDDGIPVKKKLQILAISGANSLMKLDAGDLVQRVYWSEYPDF